MAAGTAVNLAIKVADWEALWGIISQTADPEILDVGFKLQTFYAAASPKPLQNATVTIATTENVVLKLYDYLTGNTVKNIATDTGASVFTRVMAVLRAANNTADNFITNQLVIKDAAVAANQVAIRKAGRVLILMLASDGV